MKGGFPAAGFAQLAALEDRNYWFRARNRLIVWALRRHFPRMRRYLEVGCGTGCVLSAVEQAFPQASALGGEMHAAGLEHAARRVRRAQLVQMDATRLPFRREFDVVGCFDVLEHVANDGQVLAEVRGALRDDGGVIITVPQHRFLWSAADEYAGHVRRYRRSELLARLDAAGFQPLLVTSFVSLLLPVLWAARARRRRLDHRYDPEAELKVGPAANALLKAVLDFERGLIALGARFPMGGSLLVAARKTHVDTIQ